MEEKNGHEEHLKLTKQVMDQMNVEMDNLRVQQRGDSLRNSQSSSTRQHTNNTGKATILANGIGQL